MQTFALPRKQLARSSALAVLLIGIAVRFGMWDRL